MSEPVPEPRPAAPKKENVLTRKLGPLPTWAWVAIVAALLIGYFYLKNRNSQGGGTTAAPGAVPQFVNQVFTDVLPPTVGKPPDDDDRLGKHPKPPSHGPAWKDEARKDRRVHRWEHKHPGQEYPFNSWQGNPTAAELAAFNANPTWQPSMQQSQSFPAQSIGPGTTLSQSPSDQPASVVPAEQMLGGSLSGKKIV